MWLLRRMKLDPDIIFDYYAIKEVRSLAEQIVPIWNSGLTKIQISNLERIQKVSLKIILGDAYKSYEIAGDHFKIQTLSARRLELSTNYTVKLYKSDKSVDFFTHLNGPVNTRSGHQK